MSQSIAALFMTALLLSIVNTATAQKSVVRMSAVGLTDVREKLFGTAAQPGILKGSGPVDVEFERITLTAQDVPQLISLMRDIVDLPLRSEVVIRGQIGGAPFKLKREKTRTGNLEAKLEGVTFIDRDQLMNLVTPLIGQGVKQFKLKGFVGNRPIEVKFEESAPRTEAEKVQGPADR